MLERLWKRKLGAWFTSKSCHDQKIQSQYRRNWRRLKKCYKKGTTFTQISTLFFKNCFSKQRTQIGIVPYEMHEILSSSVYDNLGLRIWITSMRLCIKFYSLSHEWHCRDSSFYNKMLSDSKTITFIQIIHLSLTIILRWWRWFLSTYFPNFNSNWKLLKQEGIP